MPVPQAAIQQGQVYLAKVNNSVVPVRVDSIRRVERRIFGTLGVRTQKQAMFDVTNLVTNRPVTFRSAQKFKRFVPSAEVNDVVTKAKHLRNTMGGVSL